MEYIRGQMRQSRSNNTCLGQSIDTSPVSQGEIPAYVHNPCEGPGIILRTSGALPIALAVVLMVFWPPPADAKNHTFAGRKGVSAMVARVIPAVVSITTRRIEFDEFSRPVPKRGLGSGVIVDRRGYVLTNEHVIKRAEEIKVALPNQRTFRATLVGTDPFTDLAVLKIDGSNLPAAPLGDSSRLPIGETVVGIGYPLWIEGGPTVTLGVISGLDRSMEEPEEPDQPMLHNLIQTDAAINPGNSGGPLLNLAGQVVGINVAYMPSAHGIGFAIPVNVVRSVLRTLIVAGRIPRPSLGLVAVSVTPQVAFTNNLEVESGALVVRIEPGGPAESAGLKLGDVITSVTGEIVKDLHHFHRSLRRHKPGDAVELTLWREGQIISVRPVLREEG